MIKIETNMSNLDKYLYVFVQELVWKYILSTQICYN
jgi:hypothetical protein